LNKLFINSDKIGKKINKKSLLTLSKRKDKLFSYLLLKEILVSKSLNKTNKKDKTFTLFIKMQLNQNKTYTLISKKFKLLKKFLHQVVEELFIKEISTNIMDMLKIKV